MNYPIRDFSTPGCKRFRGVAETRNRNCRLVPEVKFNKFPVVPATNLDPSHVNV